MFTYICKICGEEFQSASNRAKYCVYCRDKAQVLRNKAYKKKKEAGTSIAVGSEQYALFAAMPIQLQAVRRNAVKIARRSRPISEKP